MRAFLLFLSSFIALLTFNMSAIEVDSVMQSSPLQKHTFQIETSNGFVSGILLVSEDDENINGSMINEFGISAIDFSYSKKKQKVKLLSVISFLNKWYIKHVLKNDIKFCLHVLYDVPFKKKHNYEVVHTVDSISIINNKRHLKYTFSPLTISTNEDDTEE